MKYKILIRLFILFILSMLTITMIGGRIRSFTCPTVAVMPLREEIPNMAFIDGGNRVYALTERTGVLGKDQYISSIELNKVGEANTTTLVDDLFYSNSYIVIGSDRPLRDNMTVKTANEFDKALIKSKYRDVLALHIGSEDDEGRIIEAIKAAGPLISDISFNSAISDNSSTVIYVRSNPGCAHILENQLVTLLNNFKSLSIVNMEFKYQRLDFLIKMYICLILIILLIISLSKCKEYINRLKESFDRDKHTYYLKEIIIRNSGTIIITAIYGTLACISYFVFFKILPLPPIPARLISEKLIYIGRFSDNLSVANKMIDRNIIMDFDLTANPDFVYMTLWIGLIILIAVTIAVFAWLKTRKVRLHKQARKGNVDNE